METSQGNSQLFLLHFQVYPYPHVISTNHFAQIILFSTIPFSFFQDIAPLLIPSLITGSFPPANLLKIIPIHLQWQKSTSHWFGPKRDLLYRMTEKIVGALTSVKTGIKYSNHFLRNLFHPLFLLFSAGLSLWPTLPKNWKNICWQWQAHTSSAQHSSKKLSLSNNFFKNPFITSDWYKDRSHAPNWTTYQGQGTEIADDKAWAACPGLELE